MSFLNYRLVMIGDRAVIFGEDIIGWEGSFALREFGIRVITLEGVQDITVLVESVSGIFVSVDAHLQEPLCRTKEFHVEAVADGIFKRFFDGIIASNIKHVIDEK